MKNIYSALGFSVNNVMSHALTAVWTHEWFLPSVNTGGNFRGPPLWFVLLSVNNSRDLNLNDLILGSIAVWSVSSTGDCILISRQHRKLSETLAVVAQPSPNLTPKVSMAHFNSDALWCIHSPNFFPTNSIEGHQLRGWSLSRRSWGVGWGVVSL